MAHFHVIFTTRTLLMVALFFPLQVESIESFTESELIQLNKLRDSVFDALYEEYMLTNEFLIRWLRDARHDVEAAAQKLRKSLEWRKKNRIDGIMVERNLTVMEPEAPYTMEAHDKLGRPIATIPFGSKWDIWKISSSGSSWMLRRHMIKMLETGAAEARKRSTEAKENSTSQWTMIIDMKGFNFRHHACLSCIQFYVDSVNDYEENYPDTLKNIIIINAPPIFERITKVARPLMSPGTSEGFKVFGFNTETYRKFLNDNIASDQLEFEYGGSKNV